MAETMRWEYRAATVGTYWSEPKDEILETLLNEWGQEGWEVINVIAQHNTSKMRVVAKRPLTPDEARRQRRSWP